ncbi:8-amino-7-oxononanoate synthase [Neoaquamicrobium sediminum]|uniref:8-amino-7-oxononanoate synthase n=1 Tax=Neoaquamicrobium sediminum TaxID=1849104 RepID=UPI0036186E10
MLRGLARRSHLRLLTPRNGIDFSSNDYLGLATSQRLTCTLTDALAAGTQVGATGSRLLRGNTPEHEQLETVAARFFRAESALFFSSGYLANFAVLTTLLQKGDLIVIDRSVHVITREAARACRAKVTEVPHNDVQAIDGAIAAWRTAGGKGHAWIAVESLYSMDGDHAPLAEIAALADRRDAFLFIDEAHATGVFGPDGRGLAHHLEGRENVLVLHSCGKALGCFGALVTAPSVLREFLVNHCLPFMYATAPSPLIAVAVTEALAILRDEPERRAHLAELVSFANKTILDRCGIEPSGSHIVPVIIGDNSRAMAIAAALQARGFDLRGIRPPTVPVGTSRLRISLTLNVKKTDVSNMVEALIEELESNAV